MRAFVDECRTAQVEAERGRYSEVGTPVKGAGSGVAASVGASHAVGEGITGRLHECAGFVAVLSLLFQSLEEWEHCKHSVLVSKY